MARGFRGITSVSLDGLEIINTPVMSGDVLLGAVVGPLVESLLRGLDNKMFGDALFGAEKGILKDKQVGKAAASVGAAAALYGVGMVRARSNPRAIATGMGHAIGALAAGLAPMAVAWLAPKLQTATSGYFAPLAGITSISLDGVGNYSGLLVQDTGRGPMSGLLVQDSQAMAGLAAVAAPEYEDDGFSALMGG